MNIDKNIQELTNRLDEVHPYYASSSTSNDQNRNDGIHLLERQKDNFS